MCLTSNCLVTFWCNIKKESSLRRGWNLILGKVMGNTFQIFVWARKLRQRGQSLASALSQAVPTAFGKARIFLVDF